MKRPPSPAAQDAQLRAPDHPQFSRRQILIGIAALAAGSSLSGWPLLGGAQATAPLSTPAGNPDFLKFSQAITGHSDLNPTTSARIEAAMTRSMPGFDQQSRALAGLLAPGMSATALLAAADAAGLRDAALAVVAAWYTGTVGAGPKATVVAYVEALMYRPVSDAQEVPTYCTHGNQWWLHEPPAVGVSAPVERPVHAPATVGNPEPRK